MTISYHWLKEYIDIPETPEELAQLLTSTGLEVESVEKHETVKGGLAGLVIGEVLTCTRHPNADKLSLTTVDIGGEKPLHIVCGAPNVAVGQKVVVAPPGATLYPAKGEPFTIRLAKIRGEQSEGMICAEDEIGLGESHAGIMVLATTAPNGTPASAFFNVSSDFILEIGLTPNRTDAMSHVGVARDIKAVRKRNVSWPSVNNFAVDNHALTIPVEVHDYEACPRYSAVTLTNVKVAESPAWLKNRLLSIGLTPINNVVDITNFVCHEIGQPLHAFDADYIKGGKVVVKTLPAGTKFTTLDNKERTLQATDLMICNAEEGMCIGGIFGGLHSGITEATTRVFLECAHFSSQHVRRTALHHGLKTDASFRHERGTDPEITVYALKRAALLMKEIAGVEISSDITDLYPSTIQRKEIWVKDAHVNRLIGKVIAREEAFAILESLDINIIEKQPDAYKVSVPQYRSDVVQEADVIEEILRIYGFDNVSLADAAKTDYLAEFPVNDLDKFKRSLGEMLTGNGFYEIWTNSLTNKAYQDRHELTFKGEPVAMLNKLSEEQGILRQTLLFTGLEVSAYNINRRQKDLRLYEFGKTYHKHDKRYDEVEMLALYMTGNAETENWRNATRATDYYDLAQQTHQLLLKTGLPGVHQETASDQLFDYGVALKKGDTIIGKMGKVKASILKSFGIKQELFYAEFSTSLLFQAANPKLVIQEVAKFPEVRRDLSLVLDKRVTFEEIRKLVNATEKRLVKNIITFDVYEGDKIPKGKKAYALGFTLLDEQKTLTDEEIDKTMARLMEAFEQQLGAHIRK